MPDPSGNCDAACVKIIIDSGMAIVAVARYIKALMRSGLVGPAIEAAEFYSDVMELVRESALNLNREHQLSADQRAAMMTQIDVACYRANTLVGWSKKTIEEVRLRADEWTIKIDGWAKDNADFFVALAKDLIK